MKLKEEGQLGGRKEGKRELEPRNTSVIIGYFEKEIIETTYQSKKKKINKMHKRKSITK